MRKLTFCTVLLHVVQTGSGTYRAACPMGAVGFSPGVKRPEREADYKFSTIAEVKKTWFYTSALPYVFVA
jgi:hypothetical protein